VAPLDIELRDGHGQLAHAQDVRRPLGDADARRSIRAAAAAAGMNAGGVPAVSTTAT
jgi:hypothetical protein